MSRDPTKERLAISAEISKALLKGDLLQPASQLMRHVAAYTTPGAVVYDDVAALTDEFVDPAVDLRVAGRGVVRPAGVDGDDTCSEFATTRDLLGDLLRLRGDVGVLLFGAHPPGWSDSHDHLARTHERSSFF